MQAPVSLAGVEAARNASMEGAREAPRGSFLGLKGAVVSIWRSGNVSKVRERFCFGQ